MFHTFFLYKDECLPFQLPYLHCDGRGAVGGGSDSQISQKLARYLWRRFSPSSQIKLTRRRRLCCILSPERHLRFSAAPLSEFGEWRLTTASVALPGGLQNGIKWRDALFATTVSSRRWTKGKHRVRIQGGTKRNPNDRRIDTVRPAGPFFSFYCLGI